MVFFKAQKLQRLAELLLRIQGEIDREGGDPSRVEEGLAEAYERAGMDREVARLADAATLERVLIPGGGRGSGKCWAVAEVLFLDGLQARAVGDEEDAQALLEKARVLYDRLDDGMELPEGVPPPSARIREIALERS